MSSLNALKSIAMRAQPTLLQDAIGAAALVVMLFAGLYLPVFV